MNTSEQFLAAVSAQERAALTRRRDGPGLWRLAVHLGAILVLGFGIALGLPRWWLLVPLQGLLIVCLFHLEHECTHQTPFRTRWINECAGHLAGFLILLPFRWFRYFHLAHHRWTNIPGRDPELATPVPQGVLGWAWYLSGLPYWGQMARVVWRLARGAETPDWLPERARSAATREARWMLAGYALAGGAAVIWPALLWVWVLPAVLAQPALRLYLLAEHGDCPQVADMFDNTRTTLTNRALRFLTWNMPYHTEHHVWPSVPFHQLPQVHSRMAGLLRHRSSGYRAFTRAYLARRLAPSTPKQEHP